MDLAGSKIAEILAFRNEGTPPCAYVKKLIEVKIDEVQARIAELEVLRDELIVLREAGKNLPADTLSPCVCQIIETGVKHRDDKESI